MTGYITAGLLSVMFILLAGVEENKPDGSEKHMYKNKTRFLIIIMQIIILFFTILSVQMNRNGTGLINMPVLINICGMLLMITGFIIRVASMKKLGKFYSTLLFVNNDSPLYTDGIYGVIRHPIYLGDLILFLSIGIAVGNYIVFAVIAVNCILIYLTRIHYEEEMMVKKFGKQYIDYTKKTKKLIPFIY